MDQLQSRKICVSVCVYVFSAKREASLQGFNQIISSSALFAIFPSTLLGEKQENISVWCAYNYLLQWKTELADKMFYSEMFAARHCNSPLTAVPGFKNTRWKFPM